MDKWFFDFIIGSISGMIGTLIGHPLDTIKVISYNISAESKPFQRKTPLCLRSFLKF